MRFFLVAAVLFVSANAGNAPSGSEVWLGAPEVESVGNYPEAVQAAARHIELYFEDVAERESRCINGKLTENEKKRLKKISTETCPTFADPLLRPIFPVDRPALSYLSGEGLRSDFGATPYWKEIKEMDRFAATEDYLGARRSRIMIGRIITNDLWPLVSPCRSRINIRRQLAYKEHLLSETSDNGFDCWLSQLAALEGPKAAFTGDLYAKRFVNAFGNATLPRDYRVADFWMLYHILNGTEHNMALRELTSEYFIFPQPLNLALLSRATNYIAYLQNQALANQIMWRESSSFWTRWSLPTTPNHFIPKSMYKGLEQNVLIAEKSKAEFMLIPTYKLISSVSDLAHLDEGNPLELSSKYKFRRVAPQVMIRFNATMDRFAAELGVNGGAAWAAAVYATALKSLAAAAADAAPVMLCPDALFMTSKLHHISTEKSLLEAFNENSKSAWFVTSALKNLKLSKKTFEIERAAFEAPGSEKNAFTRRPAVDMETLGESAEDRDGMLHELDEESKAVEKRLMEQCGYVIELESFPTQTAEGEEWCNQSFGDNVREPLYGDKAADSGREYIHLAAEVLQATVERVLTAP